VTDNNDARWKPKISHYIFVCFFHCHSSHSSADAYGLFTVLDNQQKKDKILPADIDVKQ
jgi:hypothetical protein